MATESTRSATTILYIALAFINTVIICSAQINGNATGNNTLFITISSTGEWEIDSYIELNWEFLNKNPPNEIKLFTSHPNKNTDSLVTVNINNYIKGYFVTNISLGNISLPGNWEKDSTLEPIAGPHCLNFWIAAYRNNELTEEQCLKIQPTWMQDNGHIIGDVPMDKLFIPGTHNSGSYNSDLDINFNIRAVKKFVLTQSVDVWKQLVFGNRYFDIRVGYYNTTLSPDSFWINHDKFRVNPLLDFLQTIRQFLKKSPNEVLIIDIHRFPVNFNLARHNQLKKLLEMEIGDIMIPRNFQQTPNGPTLNKIWKQKRRVIVCYNDEATVSDSTFFWTQLNQQWGNVKTKEELRTYLDIINSNHSTIQNGINPFWAAMAELTPDATFVFLSILSSGKSLGYLADTVNRDLTYWYKNDWCLKANIVATDFFLGNNIIDVAINCNIKKAKQN